MILMNNKEAFPDLVQIVNGIEDEIGSGLFDA
jgi:hypothetical protein